MEVLKAFWKSSVLLVTYFAVKHIELTQDEDIQKQKFVENILLLYGIMTLSSVLFFSSQIMRRRRAHSSISLIFFFAYYSLMFLGFFIIIQIAVKSWIPAF
jgi:hypothetical protein